MGAGAGAVAVGGDGVLVDVVDEGSASGWEAGEGDGEGGTRSPSEAGGGRRWSPRGRCRSSAGRVAAYAAPIEARRWPGARGQRSRTEH